MKPCTIQDFQFEQQTHEHVGLSEAATQQSARNVHLNHSDWLMQICLSLGVIYVIQI